MDLRDTGLILPRQTSWETPGNITLLVIIAVSEVAALFFFILTLHFDLVPLRKMKFVLPGLFLQWLSCLLLYEHEGELSVGSVFNHIFLKSLVHALGTSTMKTVFKASHR